MAANSFVLIANGRVMNPISILHPCLHLLRNLSRILHALQLPLCRHNGFDELTFWRIFKVKVQAFDMCIPSTESLTKTEVEVPITGKTLQIIEDDHKGLIWLRIKKR
ncbi:hypothetical protein PhaeoP66_03703 [Phaeobacter inhibens]|uniref:Uncharacterized protein n=1 Tax=Phaeobacter inhibens TaxID=221822 RepID=A0ABN5GS31_9RHOB|nr:hypothetical protein [Phaeobacter inhibens]AUQ96433.1 hypothetical protein PhaeoP66_03703 [Phaeobacter inhibens]